MEKEKIVNEYGQELELTDEAYRMLAEALLTENSNEPEEILHELGYTTEEIVGMSAEEWEPIAEQIAERIYSRHFRN